MLARGIERIRRCMYSSSRGEFEPRKDGEWQEMSNLGSKLPVLAVIGILRLCISILSDPKITPMSPG